MRKDIFYATDRLSAVIERDYRLVQVVSRFGVAMGFADKTISEVCHEQGVDVHTFITIVNTINNYQSATRRPISLDLVDVRSLLDYLKRTHDYLINYQLPRMRRNLFGAMDFSVHNDVALLLVKYFDMYMAEVQRHVKYEEVEVHKYVERLLEGHPIDSEKISLHRHNEDFVNKLHELIKLFLQYYPQGSNNDALNDVVYDIYRVEDDINIHCLIEDEVLIPLIRKLERRRPRQSDSSASSHDALVGTQTAMLSEREQAVAICVAKGLSNKDIAEQLFLSVNTVTTHRRNIARKLNIHSAAGIAIYCVVNKLVTLEEIKYNDM